jgi:hypothetical protein
LKILFAFALIFSPDIQNQKGGWRHSKGIGQKTILWNTNHSFRMEQAVKYYEMKYGNDLDRAFIHLIREIGQIAFGLETKNEPVFAAKVTEAIALLNFLAHKHNVNIESNIKIMYSKKLAHINSKDNTTDNRWYVRSSLGLIMIDVGFLGGSIGHSLVQHDKKWI